MSKPYVFSREHFNGQTVRTVIDGASTPPAIFFEELVGHDRLGEPTWRDFHADDLAWLHFTTCLVRSFLHVAAKKGLHVGNGREIRSRRPKGEPLRLMRELYQGTPGLCLTLSEIVKQTGIFRTSVFLVLTNPKNGWERTEDGRWCLIAKLIP